MEILDKATKEYREAYPEAIKTLSSELGLPAEETSEVIRQFLS